MITLNDTGETMNQKPVFERNAKTVLNLGAFAFGHKGLCDDATLNPGDACTSECSYCYVPAAMNKLLAPSLERMNRCHSQVVIRRANPLEVLKHQLVNKHGGPRFPDPNDQRVVFCSTTVDCAGNLRLALETAKLATLIFEHTSWQLRLLSKSSLLQAVVAHTPKEHHQRFIFGVSTGTLDDKLGAAIESGTATVTKRLQSLHWLQDHGFRTFGMICPSLPQVDYKSFAQRMAEAIRIDRCETVWAEVINLRGESLTRTVSALVSAGFSSEAAQLKAVCGPGSRTRWEAYARATFEAHAAVVPSSKLRFLQYVTTSSNSWWSTQAPKGAVPLGKHATLPFSPSNRSLPTSVSKPTSKQNETYENCA